MSALDLEILSRRFTVTARYELVIDDLSLRKTLQAGPLDRRDMDENVLRTIVRLDKPKTLSRVEPLYSASSHTYLLCLSGRSPAQDKLG